MVGLWEGNNRQWAHEKVRKSAFSIPLKINDPMVWLRSHGEAENHAPICKWQTVYIVNTHKTTKDDSKTATLLNL